MAALPSPTQVAGNHNAIYEQLYNYVDPNGYGTIGAMEAARFLKKSGLSDVVLSRVWDLSDPGGRGCLDKAGMFVALKLVALAQSGRDINLANLNMDMPPPKMGDIPLAKPKKPPPPSSNMTASNNVINASMNTPLISSLPPTAVDWTIKPSEREKYDKLFESLQPLNGMIPGNKVKGVLMDSKLPLETLGKIWDLADQDKDGMLDRHEFIVAMHLVYKALEKHAIPNQLPPELLRGRASLIQTNNVVGAERKASLIGNNKPDLPPPPIVKPMVPIQPVQPLMTAPAAPTPPPPSSSAIPQIPWVVGQDEKLKSDALFIKSDVDKDGFVSGQEIKDVFLQSGVKQHILAHIWALCDIKQSGKLNNEQFALAMWLVARCLKGIDPPPALTPEMVPPSFRSSTNSSSSTTMGASSGSLVNNKSESLIENNNTCYSNPELDMISKDIEELVREKLALEADIAQKEADIKIKSSEVKSLQSELDTLAATLKQLENQKGEAQKRLNDLKAQKVQVDKELEDVDVEINNELTKVDKLRMQANEQAETIAVQEAELMSKKEQLENLRKEEQRLEKLKSEGLVKLQQLSGNLQDTQLNISQVKALITQLQEQTRQMNDAISACDNALDSGDASLIPDTCLRIMPDFRDSNYQRMATINNNINSNATNTNINTVNGFGDGNDPFSNNQSNGFQDDPFKNDPFNNPLSANDPFTNNEFNNLRNNDGFGSSTTTAGTNPDPFGGGSTTTSNSMHGKTADPFGSAFGDDDNLNVHQTYSNEGDKDPFGCDPFAVLHAPTRDGGSGGGPPPGRPTSPSPALPPKKSKQPPPRPAPPRPSLPPSSSAAQNKNADPFNAPSSNNDNNAFGGGNTGTNAGGGGGGGFANFADFDSKFKQQQQKQDIVVAVVSANNSKTKNDKVVDKLDFTDDPFRDYRYEDPFNISFEDEDKEGEDNNDKKKDKEKAVAVAAAAAFPPPHLPPPASSSSHSGGSRHSRITAQSHSSSSNARQTPQAQAATLSSLFDDNDDKFDPFGLSSNSHSHSSFNNAFSSSLSGSGSGRQSVPLPNMLSNLSLSGSSAGFNLSASASANANSNVDGRKSAPLHGTMGTTGTGKLKMSDAEAKQLAWAAQESLKLEEARKQRELQEQADLELAIVLSKSESESQQQKHK